MEETATAEWEPSQQGALREPQERTAGRSEQDSDQETSDCDTSWDSSSEADLSLGEYDLDMELSPEADGGDHDLSQWLGVTFTTGKRPLTPVMEEEETQPCSPGDDGEQELSKWLGVTFYATKTPWSPEMEEEPKPCSPAGPGQVPQWVPVPFITGKRPLSPVMEEEEEEPQPCSPAGPSSPNPVASAVAAEAAPALPCASPALGSATEAQPAAAARDEDEWDELSVLELPLEEDKEKNQGVFPAYRLPVPVPREAWVEGWAPEACSPGTLCASPAPLEGQALEEPVLEAGTESPAAPRNRPSRFRRALRALRGLFWCPCRAPQPED